MSHPSKSSSPQPEPTPSSKMVVTGRLTLCIAAEALGTYQPATNVESSGGVAETMTAYAPVRATGYKGLLEGFLSHILHVSRNDRAQWLLDIAHDLCDPLEKRGCLQMRVASDSDHWIPVDGSMALQAAVYRYHLPPGVVICVAKHYPKNSDVRSISSVGGNAASMRKRVLSRDDGKCLVSGMGRPVVTLSHICPKRMGVYMAQYILSQFCPETQPAAGRSIYDTTFGITLSRNLAFWFEDFTLGFRFVSPQNSYECHSFALPVGEPGICQTIHGSFLPPNVPDPCPPLVHGHPVTPPQAAASNINDSDLPPSGLFRWHYLQCVVKRFGHADYYDIPNIEAPIAATIRFRDEGDESTDDDESDEDDSEDEDEEMDKDMREYINQQYDQETDEEDEDAVSDDESALGDQDDSNEVSMSDEHWPTAALDLARAAFANEKDLAAHRADTGAWVLSPAS